MFVPQLSSIPFKRGCDFHLLLSAPWKKGGHMFFVPQLSSIPFKSGRDFHLLLSAPWKKKDIIVCPAVVIDFISRK